MLGPGNIVAVQEVVAGFFPVEVIPPDSQVSFKTRTDGKDGTGCLCGASPGDLAGTVLEVEGRNRPQTT